MEKFSLTPSRISHNENPVFNASWFSGEITAPEKGQDNFYYEGSGGNDRILIYGIKWQDYSPSKEQFNTLMDKAIAAIDNWISERF